MNPFKVVFQKDGSFQKTDYYKTLEAALRATKVWLDNHKESFCGVFENNVKYILSVSRLDDKIFLASDKTLITLKYERIS